MDVKEAYIGMKRCKVSECEFIRFDKKKGYGHCTIDQHGRIKKGCEEDEPY